MTGWLIYDGWATLVLAIVLAPFVISWKFRPCPHCGMETWHRKLTNKEYLCRWCGTAFKV